MNGVEAPDRRLGDRSAPEDDVEAALQGAEQPAEGAPNPLMNWSTAHMPIATTAGTGTRNRNRKTMTRFVGNMTRYAPSTPEMAPDAPRVGMIESGSVRICAKLAMMPTTR